MKNLLRLVALLPLLALLGACANTPNGVPTASTPTATISGIWSAARSFAVVACGVEPTLSTTTNIFNARFGNASTQSNAALGEAVADLFCGGVKASAGSSAVSLRRAALPVGSSARVAFFGTTSVDGRRVKLYGTPR